jgi:hypothetical protein
MNAVSYMLGRAWPEIGEGLLLIRAGVDRVRSEYTNTIFTSTSGKTAGPT